MQYLVNLHEAPDGITVTFPDIPEASSCGADRADALFMARDALITALDFYFEGRRAVPAPRKIPKGTDSVELPASVAAKVLLLNEMVRQKVRPVELARRIGARPQTVNRLVNLHHATRVDALQEALGALGKGLELSAEPAV